MSNEELFCQDCNRAANTRCVAEKHSMAKAELDVEEIAERIATEWFNDAATGDGELIAAIASALHNRDERAAQMVSTASCICVGRPSGFAHADTCPVAIARAIREAKE